MGNHSFIPKLNDEQRDLCEGQLTYAECYKVLSTFENNKTPENDRLTYNKIGTLLVDSLNYAYFYGELSNTQKQAVITLIKKKGKDGIDQNLETNISPKRWRQNWVKSDRKKNWKSIAISIIHYDQNAFVKGRTIFDAVRTVSDVMDLTKARGYKGIMTAIDFEKTFDSVNWNFLLKSLEYFGFGESFTKWIKTIELSDK